MSGKRRPRRAGSGKKSRSLRRPAEEPTLIGLNKPFNVLCQFTDHARRTTLKSLLDMPGVYPAGRLDRDSEGLLLLTGDGKLQARIADPKYKLPKTYWVQVEGEPEAGQLAALCAGPKLNDGPTRTSLARLIDAPTLWTRHPPVRFRKTVPTAWLEITLCEGRNRQVRRMTAAVGLPTLRLVRVSIGPWHLDRLLPGEWRTLDGDALEHRADKPRFPRARRTPG